jgi:hypothetical protein
MATRTSGRLSTCPVPPPPRRPRTVTTALRSSPMPRSPANLSQIALPAGRQIPREQARAALPWPRTHPTRCRFHEGTRGVRRGDAGRRQFYLVGRRRTGVGVRASAAAMELPPPGGLPARRVHGGAPSPEQFGERPRTAGFYKTNTRQLTSQHAATCSNTYICRNR